MKGFIEVCSGEKRDFVGAEREIFVGKKILINVNAIEYISPYKDGTTFIYTRQGKRYTAKEDYETVKSLIISALTPTFTALKEHDDDRS